MTAGIRSNVFEAEGNGAVYLSQSIANRFLEGQEIRFDNFYVRGRVRALGHGLLMWAE